MKKKIYIFLAILAAFALLLTVREYCVPPEQIVKEAVKKSSVSGEYILCQRARTTGFDWHVTDAGEIGNDGEFCRIVGADPFLELPLHYDFAMADNTFVFYVESRREYYSEEMRQPIVEYTVSGWDILYPVRHEAVFGIGKSPKYILTSDLENKDTTE